ncbi:MAG: HD domain-containing protein [Syntrophales bacterium]|nr:HD domain-containing protein [Syntrophales bacterium]
MDTKTLSEAKILSEKIAAAYGSPPFYREQKDQIDASCCLMENSPVVRTCIEILTASVNISGHGLSHARKVAIDTGTIILIEGRSSGGGEDLQRQVLLAHIAGILHDIQRSVKDHARQGAEEAGMILTRFDLTDEEREAVANAIRNHEAFQPCTPLAAPGGQLLSDALYDADKFRWGPDNFTEMLWDIADTRDISMHTLLSYFPSGLQSLKKTRDTFRTKTGRQYGPGFIDLGLRIGETLYTELGKQYVGNATLHDDRQRSTTTEDS